MEAITVSQARIKFAGKFDLGDYYRLLYDIFRSMGYDVEESKYKHKTNPTGDEIELEWNCLKRSDDYTRFKIFAKTLIVGLNKVQVQIEGVPASRHTGDTELELKAQVQTDFTNRWETHPLLKFFKGFYQTYIYKNTLESLMGKLQNEMETVENEMKAFFNMQRFM
ncbi:MAG TPA: hypothetical protein ENN30_01680 [Candidatus Woesearchaeota archaeon]|nr:hypothetical protein [Candidatus Woesearchaeota archaeon]